MKLIAPLQVGLPNNLGNVLINTKDLYSAFGKPTYNNDDEISWTLTIENNDIVYTYNLYFMFNGCVRSFLFDEDKEREYSVVGCEKAIDRLLLDKLITERFALLD